MKDTNYTYKSGGMTEAQKEKVAMVMREFKEGKLRSSSGEIVTGRNQAIAIALHSAGLPQVKANVGYLAIADKFTERFPKTTGKIDEQLAQNVSANTLKGMPMAMPMKADNGMETEREDKDLSEIIEQVKEYIDNYTYVFTVGTKRYVPVEGWQYVANMMGLDVLVNEPKSVPNTNGGWMAEAYAVNASNKKVCSGTGYVDRTEPKWAKAYEYELISFSQTRAVSRALRNCISYIIRAAGYSGTPAEEIYSIASRERVKVKRPKTLPPIGDIQQETDLLEMIFGPQQISGRTAESELSMSEMQGATPTPIPARTTKTPLSEPFTKAERQPLSKDNALLEVFGWAIANEIVIRDRDFMEQISNTLKEGDLDKVMVLQKEVLQEMQDKNIVGPKPRFRLKMASQIEEYEKNKGGTFDDGGGVGHMNTAKHYWNTFDKDKRINYLVSAGYSKSVAENLSVEDWDSLEKKVHNNLSAVLMADGGDTFAGGGSTFRADNSAGLKFANFNNYSAHINLIKLKQYKTRGYGEYKDEYKYAISINGFGGDRKIMKFRNLEEAKNRFQILVNEYSKSNKLDNISEQKDNYGDGGGLKKNNYYDNYAENVTPEEIEHFIDYIMGAYRIEQTEDEREAIRQSVLQYFKELQERREDELTFTWGGGDTLDRERVYAIYKGGSYADGGGLEDSMRYISQSDVRRKYKELQAQARQTEPGTAERRNIYSEIAIMKMRNPELSRLYAEDGEELKKKNKREAFFEDNNEGLKYLPEGTSWEIATGKITNLLGASDIELLYETDDDYVFKVIGNKERIEKKYEAYQKSGYSRLYIEKVGVKNEMHLHVQKRFMKLLIINLKFPLIRLNKDGNYLGENENYAKGGQIINFSGATGNDKFKELEKAIMDKIDDYKKTSGKWATTNIKAKIITNNNSMDTIERYDLAQGGNSVLQMVKGKKRYGRMLYSVIPNKDNIVGIQFYEDAADKSYADELAAAQKYMQKNRHPNLWSDLAQDYSFTEQQLEDFRNQTKGMSHYDSWKKAGDLGLPKIEKYKTITMQSAGMPDYAQRELKNAIDNKKDYRYSWDCGYDCSVSTKMGDDGIYRGWFSQEYRGTGNGHYWLLISPTQAIFAEND